MTLEWRKGSAGAWGRISGFDEAGAREVLERDYPGSKIELRPYKGGKGRPIGWRKQDPIGSHRFGISLTTVQVKKLDALPGGSRTSKIRKMIDAL